MSALVGRARESRALGEWIDRAHERGGAVVVRGEAGIGKSALLAVMAKRAGNRGMVCLTTWGVDFHRKRAPLLFIAFAEDHIVPPKASRHDEEKYDDSVSITEFTQFPGRPYFPGVLGWEEVADYALRETHAAQAAIDQAMWCAAQSDRYVQLNDRATRSVARRQLCQQ
ncbi:MAG: AAA family ATPase [Pseudonocardiaceae bacterium]